jgi:hypothetical protein
MTNKLLLKLFEPCEIRAFRANAHTSEELARIVSRVRRRKEINIVKMEAALKRNSFLKDGDKWICRTVGVTPRFAR